MVGRESLWSGVVHFLLKTRFEGSGKSVWFFLVVVLIMIDDIIKIVFLLF